MQTVKSLFSRLYDSVAQKLDQTFKWHKLPLLIGIAILAGLRDILRAKNLAGTYSPKSPYPAVTPPTGEGQGYLTARSADGTYNDTDIPAMGSANTRFGRNVPLSHAYPGKDETILEPNPRTISLELLARDTFKPVPFLNMFAAAWIQFMIHDWFSHGSNQKENPCTVPLSDNDLWPEHTLSVLRTLRDTSRTSASNGLASTFINT